MDEAYFSTGGLPKPLPVLPGTAVPADAKEAAAPADEIVCDDPDVQAAIASAKESMKLKSEVPVLDTVNLSLPCELESSRDPLVPLSEVELSVLQSPAFYSKCFDGRYNLVRGVITHSLIHAHAR